jgi:hypothetical protein
VRTSDPSLYPELNVEEYIWVKGLQFKGTYVAALFEWIKNAIMKI